VHGRRRRRQSECRLGQRFKCKVADASLGPGHLVRAKPHLGKHATEPLPSQRGSKRTTLLTRPQPVEADIQIPEGEVVAWHRAAKVSAAVCQQLVKADSRIPRRICWSIESIGLCLAENISVNSRTSRRNRSAIPTQMRGGLLHALPVTLLKVARGRTAGG
jgi:hypothetical protein